ncbi:CRISPR-associated family protein [Vibrio parahaemolyticus VPCR-2010]|uniref:Type I-F CRISPR-associated protein Csy3 n=1 Tax=Vibrio cholerae TaxID=666 RepID=A0A5Q6PDL1_VIBCL|nr:type I-F CRISPR-associated protein Csy3 [Vibrio cholerae]EQM48593.1 CRISPR-associated family protein [Vibrio parahaemolyticus VPCR-2010]KAA1252709.1 type I-F CRISPR-associated protein Csy3 [Vibrio cholerae]HDV5593668.1 type I-F CRISPR-associated protein Csy3 [Vibrio cholerae]
MKKFEFPSVLSFNRCIYPSIGYMYAKDKESGQIKPLVVGEIKLNGVNSAYKSLTTSKEQAEGNPVLQDVVFMPNGSDTLIVKFNLKVTSELFGANNTNNPEVADFLADFVKTYDESIGLEFLAREYIKSIVSGRFLFRNRTISDELVIKISYEDESYSFEVERQDLDKTFAENADKIEALTKIFAKGLRDSNELIIFDIVAECFVGEGQEVFPSQEFVDNKNKGTRTSETKTKHLSFELVNGVRQATIHTVKLGNAIRTIDTWYSDEEGVSPIPVEPFGVEKRRAVAHRFEKAKSFYGILEKNGIQYLKDMKNGATLETIDKQVHFVIACLIRGGVISGESKKDQ